MRAFTRCLVLGAAALALLAVETTVASAACPPFPTILSKCSAGKKKCAGKKASGLLNCHAKAQNKGLDPNTDPDIAICVNKVVTKFSECYAKLDAKQDPSPGKESSICPAGSGDAGAIEAKVDAFVEDVVCALSTTGSCPPVPTILNKCSAGKKKCAGKRAAASLNCHSKAQKKGLNPNTDPTVLDCENKAITKFDACYAKLDAKQDVGKPETVCPAGNGDATPIGEKVKAFVDDVVCELSQSATPPTCGNGSLDPGEDCDLSAGATCASGTFGTDPAFACSGSCQCACPGFIEFEDRPNAACNAGANYNRLCSAPSDCPGGTCVPGLEGVFDTGWTGQSHDSPIFDRGKITLGVTSCGGSSRPCGVCNLLGPVDNLNAATYPSATGPSKDLNNRRCSNASNIVCSNDTPCFRQCLGGTNDGAACNGISTCIGGLNANAVCTAHSQCPGGACTPDCPGLGATCTPAAGTCEYYFGTFLPLAGGGVSTCIGNTISGVITGTWNVETGYSATTVSVQSIVYSTGDLSAPCSHCSGDVNPNDGARNGTCTFGPRTGKPCDVNGTMANASWGTTSLDCPPLPGGQIAKSLLDFSTTTGTKTKTLSSSSMDCLNGPAGAKCHCNTCNSLGVLPCSSNADCPDPAGPIGPICGGKRCATGVNQGAACTNPTECPGGACTVPGFATEPNSCDDDVCSPDPGTPGPNDRACLGGPFDTYCSPVETFRGCLADSDCPRAGDTCTGGKNRDCFDNGTLGESVNASGAVSTPVADQADPTLAALFCNGNTSSSGVNTAIGFPGLGRLELKFHTHGRP